VAEPGGGVGDEAGVGEGEGVVQGVEGGGHGAGL
jgi:hypothetical protein